MKHPIKLRFSLFVTLLLFALGSLAPAGLGQSSSPNLAERLGYGKDARLLIIHADDLGLAHSVNRASFDALVGGGVSSASVMMPCGWVREVAEFTARNPGADVGIHLTLNSEWGLLKWGPVASKDAVSSLLDPFGFLLPSVAETVKQASAEEVEKELRAQIALAKSMGISPTHLDTHMGTVLRSPGFAQVYLKLGRELGVPVMVVRQWVEMAPPIRQLLPEDAPLLDGLAMLDPSVPAGEWDEAYAKIIRDLKPGVTQLIVHPARDDAEMQGVAFKHPDFGAAWRERDYQFVTGSRLQEALEENNVQLISWREISSRLAKPAAVAGAVH